MEIAMGPLCSRTRPAGGGTVAVDAIGLVPQHPLPFGRLLQKATPGDRFVVRRRVLLEVALDHPRPVARPRRVAFRSVSSCGGERIGIEPDLGGCRRRPRCRMRRREIVIDDSLPRVGLEIQRFYTTSCLTDA